MLQGLIPGCRLGRDRGDDATEGGGRATASSKKTQESQTHAQKEEQKLQDEELFA